MCVLDLAWHTVKMCLKSPPKQFVKIDITSNKSYDHFHVYSFASVNSPIFYDSRHDYHRGWPGYIYCNDMVYKGNFNRW